MATITSVAMALSADLQDFSGGIDAAKGGLGGLSKTAAIASKDLDRTFGDAAGNMRSVVGELAKSHGALENVISKAAATQGKFAKAMGLDDQAAAKLSSTFLDLGSHLTSMGGGDLADTLDMIQDAMAGGSKAAKKFGFEISDLEVKEYALATGMAAADGTISDLVKSEARANLVFEKTQVALLKAGKEAGNAADETKELADKTEELADKTEDAGGGFKKLGGSILNTANLLKGAFAAAVGGAAVYGLVKMAKAGGEVEDKIARMRGTFGDSAGDIEAFADKMGRAFGSSKTEIFEAATGFGNALKGLGANDQEAAQYSEAFTRLANDMSTAFGGDVQSNLSTLQGAITGNVGALKQFGIQIEDWEVQEKAYSMGLADSGGHLTEFAKAQAAAALVVERSGDVFGAAAKDADGSTAQMANFSGQVQNLVETFQSKLAPIIAPLFGQLSEGIIYAAEVWDSLSASVQSWMGDSLGAFEGVSGGLNIVETGIGALANAWQWVDIAFKAVQVGVNKGLALIVKGLGWVVRGIDKMLAAVGLGETGMAGFFDAFADEMSAKATESAERLRDAWNAPYASESVSEQFAKIREETDKLREELSQKPLLPGVRLDEKDRPQQAKLFGEALSAGSAGAASAILAARYGAKDTVAANTKRTADLAEQSLQVQRDTLAAIAGSSGLAAAAI